MSTAELADATQRSYGTALLQRPAGVLYAFDLADPVRRAGEAAAAAAVSRSRCAVDLSALHTLSLLSVNDIRAIRSRLVDLVVAGTTPLDCMRTRERMRTLGLATHMASLRPDGTVERTELSPREKAMLVERAESLERIASTCTMSNTESLQAAIASIAVAAAEDLVLWCDDTAMRQRARSKGVATFSTVDLVTEMLRSGSSVSITDLTFRLVRSYHVDLPANLDALVAAGSADDWELGAVHTVLSRAEWWRENQNHDRDWEEIAAQAATHSVSALEALTSAALSGALESVSRGRTTQRYQQVVALAIVGIERAGATDASSLLAGVAAPFVDGVPAKAQFIRQTVANHLARLGYSDFEARAFLLIPRDD